jgi:hypothetical protein
VRGRFVLGAGAKEARLGDEAIDLRSLGEISVWCASGA